MVWTESKGLGGQPALDHLLSRFLSQKVPLEPSSDCQPQESVLEAGQ
jgi:hypothetical protein